MLIDSLYSNNEQRDNKKESPEELLKEAHFLATCTFERGTKWGSEMGFSYECLLESTFTGYLLHCKGWTSVYNYPKRPAFLGCTTIDVKDAMVQMRKFNSALLQVGLSKFSPLTFAVSRMSAIQSMCYGYLALQPLFTISLLILGTVPQFCFFKDIPLYPKLTSPWLAVFAIIWASSLLQHLHEVLSSGDPLVTWWYEQRIWVLKIVTGSLFGYLDVVLKWIGITATVFRLTNKAIDKDKMEKYEKGTFDFQGAELFMIPLGFLVLWNLVCFIGGSWRIVVNGGFGDMFGQFLLSTYILVLSYTTLIEGMRRKG
ncbi:unnamed protein product [Ilex paraguariensis]|uniref:Uncharacterized protein n=1 Tax=Ilex paraguariensis TaxID=185542 RepID=A0ABC8RYI6_9AQUA